jgi:hypothetical protein
MWGHYDNTGIGVAIELEINKCKNIYKVIYDDEYKNIKEAVYDDNYTELDTIKKILIHKTNEWNTKKSVDLSKDNKKHEKIGIN